MVGEWVVLVNPLAGTRPMEPERVRQALARRSVPGTVHVVDGPEAMGDAVVEVVRSGGRVAVVGGDGTVGLAVGALVEAGLATGAPPLGVLPAGTGCDLLRTFGIPQDVEGAAAHLGSAAEYRIDAGVIRGDFGERVFVNVAQAGVGGAAVATARHVPRALGVARYPLAFAARLPGFPPAEVELSGDRGHRGRALAVVFANAQFFAGGWNIAPKALLVDGKLDIQVIDARKREVFDLVPKIIRGMHLRHRSVRRFSAAEVGLATDRPWPVEADGELLGTTPVTVAVIPGAISLKI